MQSGGEDRLAQALSELAAERLPAILAQARQEAEARVRAVLAEMLTERMLELAAEQVTRPPEAHDRPDPHTRAPRRDEAPQGLRRPAPPRPRQDAEPTAETGLYVLGISDAGPPIPAHAPPLLGRPLQPVTDEELTAIVAQVPLSEFGEEQLRANLEDLAWLERVARAHETVLEYLCDAQAVVPARLCTIYRSEDRVRQMLRQERPALTNTLRRLQGCREWGVKVFRTGESAPEDPAAEQPASGTDYLRGRQREQDVRRHQREQLSVAVEAIHSELCEVAVDGVVNPPQRRELSGHEAEMVLNGAYLVERSREADFEALVNELSQHQIAAGLELQRTGPWPPYNFVSDPIGAGR